MAEFLEDLHPEFEPYIRTALESGQAAVDIDEEGYPTQGTSRSQYVTIMKHSSDVNVNVSYNRNSKK